MTKAGRSGAMEETQPMYDMPIMEVDEEDQDVYDNNGEEPTGFE